jgi:uridine kinase
MNHISINISDMTLAISKIQSQGHKLILIAGASASGKSFFAKKLKKELEAHNKKIILV